MERFKMVVTVCLILLKDDKVLLHRRHGTGWSDGFYAVPGGVVESDEGVINAVIRESREEINIHLLPEWLTLGCVMHTKMPGRHEAVDFFFVSRQWEKDIINTEPHKHDQLQFYPLDNIPQPIIPFMHEGIKRSLAGSTLVEFGF
jgi:8-oxo-dGTP diphosphatase